MVGLVRTQLTPMQRKLMSAKLTIDVHARDTVTAMSRTRRSVNDFEWQRQLRYYWEEDGRRLHRPPDEHRLRYGYEYLGNSMRLVITPLTDKLLHDADRGLNLGMGGAPAGPAGTGKTETTKDLAKALARQCVVMNCSTVWTTRLMADIFKGPQRRRRDGRASTSSTASTSRCSP